MSAGSDLYYEPFRWDQKFVAFILSTSGNLKVDTREVQALAEATGGEVVVSDSFQSMLGMRKFILCTPHFDLISNVHCVLYFWLQVMLNPSYRRLLLLQSL